MKNIRVSDWTHKELVKLSKNYGKSQGEIISKMVEYFKKSGVDFFEDEPKNPSEQISEMNKRLNQVVAFQREFESKKLTPILDELVLTEQRIKQMIDSKPTEEAKIKVEKVKEIMLMMDKKYKMILEKLD
jgi:hypothetical protein